MKLGPKAFMIMFIPFHMHSLAYKLVPKDIRQTLHNANEPKYHSFSMPLYKILIYKETGEVKRKGYGT